MNKFLLSISTGIFLASVLIYLICRGIFQGLISDDTGDWFLWSGGISLFVIVLLKFRNIPTNAKLGFNIFLGILILFLAIVGVFGMFTNAGRLKYGEMSGLIPYYALLTSLGLMILMVIFHFTGKKRLR